MVKLKKPCGTVELVCFIEPYREVFFLFLLCKIAVTLPASSASCKSSFSTLKLIKTFLRSTTTDMRLSDLGVLNIESRRAKALDLDVFVDQTDSTTAVSCCCSVVYLYFITFN